MRTKAKIALALLLCATGSQNSFGEDIATLMAEIQRLEEQLDAKKAELAELRVSSTDISEKSSENGTEGNENAVSIEEKSLADAIDRFTKEYGLKIRQSIKDQNQISKPATFQWVSPSDSDDSYSVDIGASINLLPATSTLIDQWYIGPSIEYHKNTLSTASKDSLLAGANFIYSEGVSFDHEGKMDPWMDYIYGSLLYKDDHIHAKDSFFSDLNYAPLSLRLFIGLRKPLIPDLLEFAWQPSVGIQFERSEDVDRTGNSGDALRGRASVDAAFYPFSSALDNRLELIGTFTYWNRMSDSGAYAERSKNLSAFKATANWYLDEKDHFAIGLDYVEGDNPQEAFFDDETWKLSLKIQF